MSDEKKAEKTPERRPTGAKEYDRIETYLATLQADGGETFPLETERLRVLLGDEAYVAVVNYERAADGKELLSPNDALASRAKLFDRKRLDRKKEE